MPVIVLRLPAAHTKAHHCIFDCRTHQILGNERVDQVFIEEQIRQRKHNRLINMAILTREWQK
jgi:hypothetical protein